MILTIGCTQFVFLSLGILAVNVLLKAGGYAPNVAANFPPFAVQLAQHALWMFCIPLAWVVFATFCAHVGNSLSNSIARVSGMAVAAAIFGIYFYASSLFF